MRRVIAMIAPTTLTQAGPQQVLGGNNDYWNYNNEGYLVRYQRNKRKALFVPDNNCPVSLEDWKPWTTTDEQSFDEQMDKMRTLRSNTMT